MIVFSSKGERPQFNKLSNGDLDGDNYLAIWDEEMTRHVGPYQCFEPDDEDSDKFFEKVFTSKSGKPTDSNDIQ